ncbi:MAG TPA: GntR family transcriptional regulator [Anaerolineales bacterium]|nr:GntR family transcriptional regulator [Anaerolineales bacterium]
MTTSTPPSRQRKALGGSPLYQQAAQRLAQILSDTPPNSFLPSEPELARQLGISRATLREAMRTFEEQGLIVRRQGVGTIVTRPPRALDAGLEVLESLETLAARTGLSVEMGELRVEERMPTVDEAGLLELSGDSKVVEVARVILAGGRPVAYLIDVVPRTVLPDEVLTRGFRGSVLDLLLRRGDPELDVSRTEIAATSATADVARALRIQRGDVLLRLEAYLYTRDGRAIDHSWSYFLPGSIRLHVVRRVGKHGRPDEGGGAGSSQV